MNRHPVQLLLLFLAIASIAGLAGCSSSEQAESCTKPEAPEDQHAGRAASEAKALYSDGRYHEAAEKYLEAEIAYQQSVHVSCQSYALAMAGRMKRLMSNSKEAIELLERSVEVGDASGVLRRRANARRELALAYRSAGRNEEALSQGRTAMALYEELGSNDKSAGMMATLARVELGQEHVEVARALIDRAYRLADDLSAVQRSYYATTRALVERAEGDLDAALESLAEAIEAANEVEHRLNAAVALLQQAEIYAAQKDWSTYTEKSSSALDYAMAAEWRSGAVEAACFAAQGLRKQELAAEAAAAYQRCADLAAEQGEQDFEGQSYFWIAQYKNDSRAAMSLFKKAADLMKSAGNDHGAAIALERAEEVRVASMPSYGAPSHRDRMRSAGNAVMQAQIRCSEMRANGQTYDPWYQTECR